MEITQRMRDDAKVYPTSNCDKISFAALVKCLEEVKPGKRAGQKKSKKTKVERLLPHQLLSILQGHSPFPLIRLIVPNCDRERPTYSIKEKVLAKLFCKAVGIEEKSEAGVALVKFNNPQFVPPGLNPCVGDFPGVLEGILKTRGFSGGKMTIGDVNARLNELAQCSSGEQRIAVIRKIYRDMSSTEIKWFARIVLKDLKIGVKHDKILSYIHPDGSDMFAKVSDMRLVLATLRDPDKRFVVSLSLMSTFEPMLAKTAYTYDCTSKFKAGFYVEWKFDGERMLVHKKGNTVKCFTRNGNDYTSKYGDIIGPLILKSVKAENCILDGEIMPWNNEAKRFGKFGSNQSVANAQKTGSAGSDSSWLCFVVFDCVLCEHPQYDSREMEQNLPSMRGNLTDCDLRTRKEYLKWLINPIEHRIYVSQSTFVEGPAAQRNAILKRWMNEVIEQCQEGIMIKSVASPYICGGRVSKKLGHWIKLKPEYFDKMRDNLDLVVLAGYYGDGRSCTKRERAGKISTFLIGVVDDDTSTSTQPRFLTVGKVGTGYSFDELKKLREWLEPYTEVFDNDAQTPSEDYWMGWHASKTDDIPDVWYRPQIVESKRSKHDLGYVETSTSSLPSSLGSQSSPMRGRTVSGSQGSATGSQQSQQSQPSQQSQGSAVKAVSFASQEEDVTANSTGASTPQKRKTIKKVVYRAPLVFEVTASELTICDTFNSGFVVRFPRVNKIRWTKDWTEAETLDQLQERFNEGKAFRKNDDGKKENGTKRANNGRKQKGGSKKRRGVGGVVANRSTKSTDDDDHPMQIKSNVLLGTGFYITARDTSFRQRIARMVEEHGGTIHANLLSETSEQATDYVITDVARGLHFKNIVNSDSIDILTSKWLDDCVRESRLVDYAKNESYYFHLCEETRLNHLEDEDPYNDSYTKSIENVNELKLRLDKASQMLGASANEVSAAQMCGSDRDVFVRMMAQPSSIWSALQNEMEVDDYEELVHGSKSIFAGRVKIYCPKKNNAEVIVALHDMIRNGAERSKQGAATCTHVLVDLQDEESIRTVRNEMRVLREASNVPIPMVRFVSAAWVQVCIDRNEFVMDNMNDGIHGPLPAHENSA